MLVWRVDAAGLGTVETDMWSCKRCPEPMCRYSLWVRKNFTTENTENRGDSRRVFRWNVRRRFMTVPMGSVHGRCVVRCLREVSWFFVFSVVTVLPSQSASPDYGRRR